MRGQLWLLYEFGLSHSNCTGVVKILKMRYKEDASVIPPSIHPSICWPFPALSVVRVSVYLPWRPADVYCDGIEYSSYQYGLHQCWISHSGLAGCPPAAYSNIVSRIVIIGAELRPCSPGAAEYSQIRKKYLCFHLATKEFHFSPQTWNHGAKGRCRRGSGGACIHITGRKGRMER